MHLKMSGKRRPFCLGLNGLTSTHVVPQWPVPVKSSLWQSVWGLYSDIYGRPQKTARKPRLEHFPRLYDSYRPTTQPKPSAYACITITGIITVIMGMIASQITSLTIVYPTVIQMQIKGNIKAPRHWPLCGEFTRDLWIPCTNGQ